MTDNEREEFYNFINHPDRAYFLFSKQVRAALLDTWVASRAQLAESPYKEQGDE